MSHKHHHRHKCHKTKCKSAFFKEPEIIVITKHGKAPRWQFCDQKRAFPITRRKCLKE